MAEKEYISIDVAYDIGTLEDWYINSISQSDTPVWTEEHLAEQLDSYIADFRKPYTIMKLCAEHSKI